MYKLFVIFFAAIMAVGLSSCNFPSDEIVNKRKEKSEDFRALIGKFCQNSDELRLTIKNNILELPCGHRQHIKLFPVSEELNYKEVNYLQGLSPIPIDSIQLMIESPGDLKKIWNVAPPAGVVVNIYSPSVPKIAQECKVYKNPERSNCTHKILISGTNLGATLRFNGHDIPAFSSYTGKRITSEEFPYDFYPETKWPELYEQTQVFVKSLVVKN